MCFFKKKKKDDNKDKPKGTSTAKDLTVEKLNKLSQGLSSDPAR